MLAMPSYDAACKVPEITLVVRCCVALTKCQIQQAVCVQPAYTQASKQSARPVPGGHWVQVLLVFVLVCWGITACPF